MTTTHTLPASVDVSLLEPLLRDMVGLIGIANTLRIVAHFGGTRMWVPANVKADNIVAKLIGLEDAQKLAAQLGGNRPLIPRAMPAMRAVRDAAIVANADQLSVPELARRFDLAERQIYNIRAGSRSPNRHTVGDLAARPAQQQWHLFGLPQ